MSPPVSPRSQARKRALPRDDVRFQCAHGTTQRGRGFFVREPVLETQHQRRTLRLGQRCQPLQPDRAPSPQIASTVAIITGLFLEELRASLLRGATRPAVRWPRWRTARWKTSRRRESRAAPRCALMKVSCATIVRERMGSCRACAAGIRAPAADAGARARRTPRGRHRAGRARSATHRFPSARADQRLRVASCRIAVTTLATP